MENSELATLLRTIISKMNKRLRKQMHAVDNFSITEITALSYLHSEGQLSPSELAVLLKIKTQSMSDVLKRFTEQDLIDKSASESDKRKVLISLSAAGRLAVEKTRYERDEWLTNAIEHHLNKKEKQLLADAIALMDKLSDFK